MRSDIMHAFTLLALAVPCRGTGAMASGAKLD